MAKKIEIEIVGDAKGFQKSLGQAANSADSFGSSLGKMTKYAGLALGAAGIGGLAVTLKAGIAEFSEASKVAAQTNAVLESTGGVAKVTAKEVSNLAQSLMRKSGVDDEAIQSGENMLLTFTKIRNEAGKGNDIFNQATKATLDLSVAMGKDMTDSAILVGKALNDPLKGMTALGRAGIQFTEAQRDAIKAMVESGNVMGAQKMILEELNTQFGGSAEAIGKTLPGQLNILKESFSNMAGEIVTAAVPAFTRIIESAGEFVSQLSSAEGIRAKFSVAIGGIKDVLASAGAEVSAWGEGWSTAVSTAEGALGRLGGFVSSQLGQVSLVVGGVATAFAVSVAKMVEAWKGLQVALGRINPVFAAITIAVGLVGGAIFDMATKGDGASASLKRLKDNLEALLGTARAAEDAELGLAEAKNRLKGAALAVEQATKTQTQAEASAGKGSLAYRQATQQLEAAQLARRRAADDVAAAEEKATAATDKAEKTQLGAKQSVQALTTAFNTYRGARSQVELVEASGQKVTKEMQDQFERDAARRFAEDMRALGVKASATAKTLRSEGEPALARIAEGVAKASTANAKFAEETGKIPTTIAEIKGPASTAMTQLGTDVAAKAGTAGASVGASFAQGVGSGIAANLGFAAAQAEALVVKAEQAARAAAQSRSPSKLFAEVGADAVRGFILGITSQQPAVEGKMKEAVAKALEAARSVVAASQGRLAEAFGNLGEFAARAFAAKTDQLLAKVAARFDRQIASWQKYADAMTPAEQALADLDKAEDQRSREQASRAAQDALTLAEAMEAGIEREKAIAAAREQIRQADLANQRAALQEQAVTERAAREQEAAEHIARLEETKARELQNLEERRRQLGEKLDEQLTVLQERLSRHPEEYDKIQKKIQTLLKSYGIPMQKSGELLGKAFAKGLDNAADDVAKSAKALAAIVEKYLRLRSPAKAGPLSTVDRWFKPLGPMLARQMNPAALVRASAGMAGAAVPRASYAGAAAAGGGQTVQHFHFPNYLGNERELVRAVRTELNRVAGRNG